MVPPDRIRTCDLLLRRQTLYPLSYRGPRRDCTSVPAPERNRRETATCPTMPRGLRPPSRSGLADDGTLTNVTPEELAAAIRTVLEEASAEGSLALPAAEIPDPRVERPRNRDHGDWSTNVAMQLAKKAGTRPRDLAELLVPRLEALDGVASVEVAGPGFLNIRLDAASAGELARSIVEAGQAYGRNDSLSGQHINLEYVSANPTGRSTWVRPLGRRR